MNSLSPLTVCLCIQLSACLLGSTASAGASLWGKKVHFTGRPCLWQLQPDAPVPSLRELSVCMLLCHNFVTQWTGFVYKAPGRRNIELGLGGTSAELTVWLLEKAHHLKWELKSNQWSSVCITWSGRARRLRTYVNGTILYEASLDPTLPQQLAPNGTLTLGVSHYIDANGEVQSETGNNLLGEIGLFRIWAREWSPEDLQSDSCVDGDVVSWDLRQWKYSCPPKPDNNLHCAWSCYKIKMWTFIAHSSEPGNCSVSLEGVTRNWLESVFPPSIAVHDIYVSSPSHTCHVVNNSAGLHVQQRQGSKTSPGTCDNCFSSEVHVNVDPAANVEAVQADITALLNLTFSDNFLHLTADPDSISILPVEKFAVVTEPPTTVSTGVITSGTGPTQIVPGRPANMSTTGEPLDLNETAVGADTFFRVNMTLSMTGSPTNPKDVIEKWVKKELQVNNTMLVLNLIIKENVGRNMEQNNGLTTSHLQQKQYYCTFHIQEYNINSVAEILTFIQAALTSKYENGSIIIQATNVTVKHIMPENCSEETTSTVYGQYIWPETFPQVKQEMGCNKPKSEKAYRLCKLNIETDTTSWAEPDMTNCNQLVTMSDLDNITVTTGNAAEVVDVIQNLVDIQLNKSAELSPSELNSVVEKLSEVVDISVIKPAVSGDIVNMIADILLSETDVTPVANIVLKLTDKMGDNMDFPGELVTLTAPTLALSMINADADGFSGLTFGASFGPSLSIPNTFVSQSFLNKPIPDTNATISLPSELHNFFTRNTTRVQFHFYGTDELFQDHDTTNTTESSLTLNSFIVSASVNNTHVSNLKDRVVVTLSHLKPKQPKDKVQCMFWDFQKNGGQGGWNSRGCETQTVSSYQTRCLCNHLTHFAVLLDVSRTDISEADSEILTVISYFGCGISSIFLGITLITYIAFEKLRRDYPSKILINLSVALLGLNMIFLLDAWLSSFSNYGLCIATAATLHYFMLASFTWMGLEAVHMYLALVKVFNIYVPSYILKFCTVGWGIPLIIVSLVLIIDKDAYGSTVAEEAAVMLQYTDQFCWLQNDVFFYATVVAFVLLILLCNITVFIVVLIQIRQMGANKPSANSRSSLQDLRAVASLTVLLGLTWSMGFFFFGPGKVVLMYLFSIFNTLQGFFVFLFHCLMKENVRKQWRIHLCCGRFRLSDHSDWSRSVTAGGRCKKKNLVNGDSVASDDTSTIRKVSDSSTGSAPNHHHQGA
ncbi:adhesion G-protein coupled receptor G6 [Trachinotus anak]|uniref:adhesion G-protein coupled receptor G6 n=1 Tax=Trachinotus anak TaxID=443729 RepID=UPI0039F26019